MSYRETNENKVLCPLSMINSKQKPVWVSSRMVTSCRGRKQAEKPTNTQTTLQCVSAVHCYGFPIKPRPLLYVEKKVHAVIKPGKIWAMQKHIPCQNCQTS